MKKINFKYIKASHDLNVFISSKLPVHSDKTDFDVSMSEFICILLLSYQNCITNGRFNKANGSDSHQVKQFANTVISEQLSALAAAFFPNEKEYTATSRILRHLRHLAEHDLIKLDEKELPVVRITFSEELVKNFFDAKKYTLIDLSNFTKHSYILPSCREQLQKEQESRKMSLQCQVRGRDCMLIIELLIKWRELYMNKHNHKFNTHAEIDIDEFISSLSTDIFRYENKYSARKVLKHLLKRLSEKFGAISITDQIISLSSYLLASVLKTAQAAKDAYEKTIAKLQRSPIQSNQRQRQNRRWDPSSGMAEGYRPPLTC